jgi:hypothetical protein
VIKVDTDGVPGITSNDKTIIDLLNLEFTFEEVLICLIKVGFQF